MLTAAQITEIITVVAAVIKEAVDLGPTLIKSVKDAEPFAEVIINSLLGKEVTLEDLNQIEKQIKALSAELQKPLPDAQDDDV